MQKKLNCCVLDNEKCAGGIDKGNNNLIFVTQLTGNSIDSARVCAHNKWVPDSELSIRFVSWDVTLIHCGPKSSRFSEGGEGGELVAWP